MKLTPINLLNWYRTLSLKQRYLSATLLFSVIVISIAFYGWRYVDHVSHQQLVHIEERTKASGEMHHALHQIHIIETILQKFANNPTEQHENNIRRSLHLFGVSIKSLRSNAWIQQDPSLTGLVIALGNDKIKLTNVAMEMIAVRKDEARWIPAMHIMESQMTDYNILFMTELNLNVAGLGEELNTKQSIKVYTLLNELRHFWTLMVSEVRLALLIRFGGFSVDPAQGIEARKNNVKLYLGRINSILVELETLKSPDMVDRSSLVEMRRLLSVWTNAHNEIFASITNADWRNDIVVFQNKVKPALNQIQQRASSLQLEVGVATAKNITNLTTLALNLSNFVIIVAISIALVSLLGYFIFQRSIIRPIHQFGLALQSEASGKYRDTKKKKTHSFRSRRIQKPNACF